MSHGWTIQSEILHGVVDMKVIMTDLLEHPALKAWCTLDLGLRHPHCVTTLKPAHRKSAVYRLEGVGMTGSAVIAKRCQRATALIEHTIYTDIFPHIPLPTLYYYGTFEEADGQFCWIFIEDVGKVRYSPSNSTHRALGAQWLGTLHISASYLTESVVLPEKTPNHYLDILRSARDTLIRSQTNSVFSNHDLKTLEAIVSHSNLLESHWSAVENLWRKMPRTLVHGGFYSKNVRVQDRRGQPTIFPFDWESAGWGVPAIDLAQEDIGLYWSVVRDHWPWLTLKTLQTLADFGKIFWALKAIPEEAPTLTSPWVFKVMEKMKYYQRAMTTAIEAIEWEG